MVANDLSEPERLLWNAFPCGTWVDLRAHGSTADDLQGGGSWDASRTVRAEVVAALLLGAGADEPGRAPAVRLRGARISGRLDLMGAVLRSPLVLEGCYFDEEPRFVESTAKTVWIAASRLPGFNGTRMRLEGILNLRASTVSSAIRLDQAQVGGQLCLRDVAAGADAAEVAIAADRLNVDGSVDLVRLAARGTVWLEGVHVSGMIDLTGAEISGTRKGAITLSNALIDGRLRCDGLSADGGIRMRNTQVGASFVLSGARLLAPSGVALDAGGLTVRGGVFCTRGFVAEGQLRLIGARLDANLSLTGAVISNQGAIALDLNRATIGDFDASGITCSGQVSCVGTRVGSQFNLTGARLDSADRRPALNADGSTVEGPLMLAGLKAGGEVSFRMSRVRDQVLLNGARLENPDGIALQFSHAEIAADLRCENVTVNGMIELSSAKLGGSVILKQARLDNSPDVSLDARYLQAVRVELTSTCFVQGTVDLGYAHIGLLSDDPAHWPAALNLTGLTYQALEPQLPARERLRWLLLSPNSQHPQPYEQLASYYNAIGQPTQARRILYERERRRSINRGPLGRPWSLLQDLTVGYGYQPWRAAFWLTLLLATGTIVFHASPPPPLQNGTNPHFNPLIYTLDLLLPIVNLGQKGAFNPVGAEQWFSYALMAAGWVLVTTIAAGIARVLRRS
jgi:hypothetical protein